MTAVEGRGPIPVIRPWLGVEEAAAAAEAVESGWIAQGPRVARFEAAFAAMVGAPEAVAVSSCTAALHLMLHLLGVGPGDEVVVPSLSFIATANAVRYTGATPVFADVDGATLNLDRATVEEVITPSTRAVLAVHQCGTPAPLDDLAALCRRAGVDLVEDAACAVGSTYRGVPIGGGGRLAAFSFHPRKLVTTGEGGMLVTPDADLAARARRLREHGMSVSAADRHRVDRAIVERYGEVGFNYRMTDVQAAIGLVQLGRVPEMIRQRRARAARYRERLAAAGLLTASDPPWGQANFQSFWVLMPPDAPLERDELLDRMLAQGISCRRGIMAAHLEPAYEDIAHRPLPVTEMVTARSLILPLYHQMTDGDQDRVVDALLDELRGAATTGKPPQNRRRTT